MRLSLLFLIALLPAAAQLPPPIRVNSELDKYLDITVEQNRRMAQNTDQHFSWSVEKMQRLTQVRAEIVAETAKAQLDPMALGLRYVEVEAICRQGREKTEELRRNNLQVLTAAQRTKLATLEEALKFAGLIQEAQGRNFLDGPLVQVIRTELPNGSGIASFVLGSISASPLTGCPGWLISSRSVIIPTPSLP